MDIVMVFNILIGIVVSIVGYMCKDLLSEVRALRDVVTRLDVQLKAMENGAYDARIRGLEQRVAVLESKQ